MQQFVFAEKTDAKNDSNAAQTTEATAVATTDENELPITTPSGGSNVSGGKTTNGVWVVLRTLLVLAFVILVMWLVFKFMKKGMQPGAENDPFLRKVSSITLSPGKSVQIVTLMEHAYIIGVTDNAVNLIGTVDDKELIDAMNLYADKNGNTKKPRNFEEILDLFMPHGPHAKTAENKKKNASVFDGSAEQVVDMLKKQRERLNEESEK